jgi:outer membrane receptor protein involved in Fe transport
MRSEDIDRIEVLSIPSGRDMMEMGGGYINIVMRRDQTFGWRGDISTEAGVSDDWSGRANGSVSFASEKFDMTIDAHGGRTTQTKDNLMTYSIEDKDAQTGPIQTTDNQTNDIEYLNLISETHAKQKDKELAANLMLRYQPTKYLELGGMLSCQIQWPEKVISGVASVLGSSVSSEAHQDPKENTTTKNLTAYCDWRFDSKGKRLSLTYSDYKKDDDGMSKVSGDNYNSRMSSYYGPSSPIWKYESFESEVDYHIQSARLDLTLPFRYITVDAGASYTNIRNQANLKAQKSSTMSYYDNKVNMLDYQEKTKSAYLSLHHDWGKFAVKAGLRYERIEWDEEVEANTSYMVIGGNTTTFSQESKDYWLPSASLSYKPLEGHQINISWGTGTIRPNFYDLNPFRIYKSTFEYSEGNPLLKPSRISNIELNYFNRHGLYACAYHRHSSDKVMMFTLLSTHYIKEIIRMDHAITTPYNDGRINQTGLYLRYQRQLAKHLMTMVEGDVFYHDATSRGSHDRPLYGWGKRMAISADWYLDRRHTLLLSGRYQHWFADYHDMTKTDGYGYFCFALRYAMLDDRLKLSLVANDPFRQHITDETIYNSKDMWLGMISEYMEQHLSHTNHHSHYIGLTATYTLGGKKVRHIHHDMEKAESKRAERQ